MNGADPATGEPERLAPAGPEAVPPQDPHAWSCRFIGGPPRLLEMKELYESLGYEVRLERLSEAQLAEECQGCRLALELFRAVYTRRKP